VAKPKAVATAARRPLLLVSAGLGLAGGGSAVVGRLCAAVMARFASRTGAGFEILHLGPPPEAPLGGQDPPAAITGFGGDTGALARAVIGRQLSAPRPLIFFDHLGPSRCQALMPSLLRAPYLVFLHGVESWRPLSWDRRRALGRASALLANSDHTRRRARAFNKTLPPVDLLPLALEDRPLAGTVDEDLLDRCGAAFLLIVGRMAADERYKGHDELLGALPALLDRHPQARLVVVGGGDDRARLEAESRQRGLADAVLFTGFVSEATRAELYQRCLAFVMPSRDEGFGLVFLEAMRAAKPCLAALGSAAEEIVEGGRTGLLVDRDDPVALTAGLASFYDYPERAARLGEAGRRRFEDRFRHTAFERGLLPYLDRFSSRTPQTVRLPDD
jgi:phosphatidylinositol alpha-1,6-mannosyltransferase